MGSGTAAAIAVADNGEGIASQEIPHIFDRYYQPDAEETTGNTGQGLGLAIVKKIVELHRSQLAVQSELHKGTQFSFWLPVTESGHSSPAFAA